MRINKQGLELSINFLVVLILTIVTLGLGITFASNVFSTSSDLSDEAFIDLDKNLENLYCSGNIVVCIGRDTVTLKPKQRQTFTLHVVNPNLGDGQFSYLVEEGSAFDENLIPITTNPLEFLPIEEKFFDLKNTEEASLGIIVQAPAGIAKGTYTITVSVFEYLTNPNAPTLYGRKKRIHINI